MPDPWLKTKKYKGMKYINRHSLLVRKKQPFVDWVNYMDALYSSPDSLMATMFSCHRGSQYPFPYGKQYS